MKAQRTAGVAALIGVLLLSGCGADGEESSDSTTDAEVARGGPGGPGGGGPGGGQFEEMQQCLEDAGLADSLPRRGGAPPQSSGGGEPPSGGGLMDEEVQNALEDCGIELPGPPGGRDPADQGSST